MAAKRKSGVRSKRRCRGKGEGSVFQRNGRGSYYIQWVDERGTTRCKSSRSRDYAVASELLGREVKRVDRIRSGYVSPSDETRREGLSAPIQRHLDAYMRDCTTEGQSARWLLQRRRNLEQWVATSGIRNLQDCTKESLTRFLTQRQQARRGRGGANTGARVWNQIRGQASAFLDWCCVNGFAACNPLKAVKCRSEPDDVRCERRALTEDEVQRLLGVARPRGREAWYLLAMNCGLRKSDIQRLDWANITFRREGGGDIRVAIQKAKRGDTIPMDKALAALLQERWVDAGSPCSGRVFVSTVTDRTRDRDMARAGIALKDAAGRRVDLHAMRTTLVMRLVRSHTPLLWATKILRHKDIKTTLKYYTDVVPDDLRESLEKAVAIG